MQWGEEEDLWRTCQKKAKKDLLESLTATLV